MVKRSSTVSCKLIRPDVYYRTITANQKYVYKRWKLCIHKIKRNAQYSDLYTILYQRLTNAILKGTLLHFKIIIKMYLIENKEVTLLIQLNW